MEAPKPTGGYADRITKACAAGPRAMSVRRLGEAVEEKYGAEGAGRRGARKLRGATYGGVRQYAAGKIANPSVELLRAIADILGVRSEWLAFGEEPMTEAQAAEQARAPLHKPDLVRQTTAAVLTAIFEEQPALRPIGVFGIERLILACVPEVALWIGPRGAALTDAENTADRYVDAARRLGRAIAAPLRELGIDPGHLGNTMQAQWLKAQYLTVAMSMLVPLVEVAFGEVVRLRTNENATEEGADDGEA